MTQHEARQNDTAEIMPNATLDLRNAHDRADFDTFILFLSYLADMGVATYVTLAIARDLYGDKIVGQVPAGSDAQHIFEQAHRDIDNTNAEITLADAIGAIGGLVSGLFGNEPAAKPEAPVTYDLRKVATGAPSLALLVEYAHRVPTAIFPAHAIPSPAFVKRCLALFHWQKQQDLAEETADIDEADDSQPGTTPAAAVTTGSTLVRTSDELLG